MKKNKFHIFLNRAFILVLAAFISLFASFNQSIEHVFQEYTINTALPVQDEDAPTQESNYAIISSAAIIPFIQLATDCISFFIFEISSFKDKILILDNSVPNYINNYFKTLFSRIISPNAP